MKLTMIFIIIIFFYTKKEWFNLCSCNTLSLFLFLCFLHPPKTRWYVRFNEKGVVRDRNGTRMRSQLLQRAAVDDIRGNIKSVMQEGWFRSRKGSFLKPRLPTLGTDAICLFLDREYRCCGNNPRCFRGILTMSRYRKSLQNTLQFPLTLY